MRDTVIDDLKDSLKDKFKDWIDDIDWFGIGTTLYHLGMMKKNDTLKDVCNHEIFDTAREFFEHARKYLTIAINLIVRDGKLGLMDVKLYNNYALICFELGDVDEAVLFLETAIALDPTEPSLKDNLKQVKHAKELK